ncbi:hypothetical protein HDU81_004708 [Chytriomyces hyalinus]|nr:hypothetical protein HDU81_004708 [Chytriomyces hyalinus]
MDSLLIAFYAPNDPFQTQVPASNDPCNPSDAYQLSFTLPILDAHVTTAGAMGTTSYVSFKLSPGRDSAIATWALSFNTTPAAMFATVRYVTAGASVCLAQPTYDHLIILDTSALRASRTNATETATLIASSNMTALATGTLPGSLFASATPYLGPSTAGGGIFPPILPGPSTTDTPDSSLTKPAVVAVAVACSVGVLAAAAVAIFVLYRRRHLKKNTPTVPPLLPGGDAAGDEDSPFITTTETLEHNFIGGEEGKKVSTDDDQEWMSSLNRSQHVPPPYFHRDASGGPETAERAAAEHHHHHYLSVPKINLQVHVVNGATTTEQDPFADPFDDSQVTLLRTKSSGGSSYPDATKSLDEEHFPTLHRRSGPDSSTTADFASSAAIRDEYAVQVAARFRIEMQQPYHEDSDEDSEESLHGLRPKPSSGGKRVGHRKRRTSCASGQTGTSTGTDEGGGIVQNSKRTQMQQGTPTFDGTADNHEDLARTVQTILRTLCPLSIAANASLVVSVIIIKKLHKPLNYLQGLLSISEIIVAINLMVGTSAISQGALCTALGIFYQFFAVGQSCWNVIISFYCYVLVTSGIKDADAYWSYFMIYGWGVPALFTSLLFVAQAAMGRSGPLFGDALYTCWISSEYSELRLALFFDVIWVHFFILMALYIRMFHAAKRMQNDIESLDVIHASNSGRLSAKEAVPSSGVAVASSTSLTRMPGTNPVFFVQQSNVPSIAGDDIKKSNGNITPGESNSSLNNGSLGNLQHARLQSAQSRETLTSDSRFSARISFQPSLLAQAGQVRDRPVSAYSGITAHAVPLDASCGPKSGSTSNLNYIGVSGHVVQSTVDRYQSSQHDLRALQLRNSLAAVGKSASVSNMSLSAVQGGHRHTTALRQEWQSAYSIDRQDTPTSKHPEIICTPVGESKVSSNNSMASTLKDTRFLLAQPTAAIPSLPYRSEINSCTKILIRAVAIGCGHV